MSTPGRANMARKVGRTGVARATRSVAVWTAD